MKNSAIILKQSTRLSLAYSIYLIAQGLKAAKHLAYLYLIHLWLFMVIVLAARPEPFWLGSTSADSLMNSKKSICYKVSIKLANLQILIHLANYQQ